MNAAIASISSWQRFEALTARHRIGGLVHHALAGHSAVPDATSTRLAQQAQQSAAFDLVLAAETAALQERFDAAGLPVLFVKGATLGVRAYGALGIKQSWDIDLLTTPDSVASALKLMEAAGYRLTAPAPEHIASVPRMVRFFHEVLLSDPRGLPVELHWRLSAKPQDLAGLHACAPHQIVPVGGRAVRTLRDDLLVSYLIAHGQKHGWSRLKWLADLHALLVQPSIDTDAVWANAEALGLGDSAAAALVLCNRLFDLPLPTDIAQRGNRRSVARLVRVDLACLGHSQGGSDISEVSPTQLSLMLSELRSATGWRSLAAELAVIWTQPDVRVRYSARFDFLYHLLRVPLFLWHLPQKLHRLYCMSRSGPAR